MRTNGMGKVIITSTPKGSGWLQPLMVTQISGSWYQSKSSPKNLNIDTKGKLMIQNYNKEVGHGVWWAWDLISADELDDSYMFALRNRVNPYLEIYVSLGRLLQMAPEPYSEMRYQVYIHNQLNSPVGEWDFTAWVRPEDLGHKKFWGLVERIVEDKQPTDLPF
jgi:hypothetical protein